MTGERAQERMTEWKYYGKHGLVFEGSDLILFSGGGDFSVEEFQQLTQEIKQRTTGWPYVMVLANMANIGSISAEARRAAAEGLRDTPFRGISSYGASFQSRLLINLI